MNGTKICVILALCLAPACRCGREAESRPSPERPEKRGQEGPDRATEPPPPPSRQVHTGLPPDPRFGPATIELLAAGEVMRVHPKVAIPAEHASEVPEQTVQRCSIHFDHGPPIAITLVASAGFWDGGEVSVPPAVRPAKTATIAIQTRPQTTYRFPVEGAWDRVRPESPVTIEAAR